MRDFIYFFNTRSNIDLQTSSKIGGASSERLPPRPDAAGRAIHAILPHGPPTFLEVGMC